MFGGRLRLLVEIDGLSSRRSRRTTATHAALRHERASPSSRRACSCVADAREPEHTARPLWPYSMLSAHDVPDDAQFPQRRRARQARQATKRQTSERATKTRRIRAFRREVADSDLSERAALRAPTRVTSPCASYIYDLGAPDVPGRQDRARHGWGSRHRPGDRRAARAQGGARVAVAGRTQAEIEETAAAIGGVAVRLDVGDRDGAPPAIAALEGQVGHIDVLVNNAAAPRARRSTGPATRSGTACSRST